MFPGVSLWVLSWSGHILPQKYTPPKPWFCSPNKNVQSCVFLGSHYRSNRFESVTCRYMRWWRRALESFTWAPSHTKPVFQTLFLGFWVLGRCFTPAPPLEVPRSLGLLSRTQKPWVWITKGRKSKWIQFLRPCLARRTQFSEQNARPRLGSPSQQVGGKMSSTTGVGKIRRDGHLEGLLTYWCL